MHARQDGEPCQAECRCGAGPADQAVLSVHEVGGVRADDQNEHAPDLAGDADPIRPDLTDHEDRCRSRLSQQPNRHRKRAEVVDHAEAEDDDDSRGQLPRERTAPNSEREKRSGHHRAAPEHRHLRGVDLQRVGRHPIDEADGESEPARDRRKDEADAESDQERHSLTQTVLGVPAWTSISLCRMKPCRS